MPAQYQVVVKADPEKLSRAGAKYFAQSAADAVTKRGVFAVALSGGSTPRGMHRLLAQEPIISTVPWQKVHIFWVDERCVPATDPASNYGAAREDFLDRVPLAKENIHPMPVHLSPREGARHYQDHIIRFFGTGSGEIPAFDLILLGIGTDGHTASLFPGTPALNETKLLVQAVKGGSPFVDRLTMTYPLLNRARDILFLASGANKAAVVEAVIRQKQPELPAAGIHPASGRLTWLLDRKATALL